MESNRRVSVAPSHTVISSSTPNLRRRRPTAPIPWALVAIVLCLITLSMSPTTVLASNRSLPSRPVAAYRWEELFGGACLLLVIAVSWAAHKFRVRGLHHEFEMVLEARVAERTRIARDLHDTLLQSLQSLLLHFQTVSEMLPQSAAKTKLDCTIQQTADAITEGRDAVQGLRASIAEANHLTEAMTALGKDLATNYEGEVAPAFALTVEGKPRDLHPIVRDDVYKIAAEALRNAFKHANADRIEVEICYDSEQFRLRVRDDGRGIDRSALSIQNGHYGLHGMRERASLIGGTVVVWSEVDAGTEMELRVPSDVVFAAARNRNACVSRQ